MYGSINDVVRGCSFLISNESKKERQNEQRESRPCPNSSPKRRQHRIQTDHAERIHPDDSTLDRENISTLSPPLLLLPVREDLLLSPKTPRLLHHALPTSHHILPPRTLGPDRPSNAEEFPRKESLREHDVLPSVDAVVEFAVEFVELDLVGDSWRVETEDDEGEGDGGDELEDRSLGRGGVGRRESGGDES